ncbi:MAG: hypothetical protein ACI4JK_02040 [Oscillospiraceae bacterium]
MKNISKETQELVIKELEKLGEYDSAEYLGEWNGYDVFSPTFEDLSNAPIIGIPPFFLVKNNKLSVVMYGIDSRFETIEKLFN